MRRTRVIAILLLLFLAWLAACKSAKPRPVLNAQQERGRRVFNARCAQCHDAESTDPRQGPGLEGLYQRPYLPSSGAPVNDDRVRDSILLGRRNMPPMRNALDDEQLADLLAYLRTL